MRSAVTFIELIFVMVILGILAGIGFGFVKTNTAYRDGEAVLLKLKETRYKAMGYGELDESCLELTQEALSDPKNEAGGYQIKSIISSDANTICFDSLGRPHDSNSVDLNTLMGEPLDISLYYGDQNCTIVVFQQSGYAIIACN